MSALAMTLLAVPVWAQHRGGGSAGSISRAGMAVHGAGMAVHGAGMAVHGAGMAVRGSGLAVGGYGLRGSGAAHRYGIYSGGGFGPRRPLIYSNRYYRRGYYGYPWAYGYPGAYYLYPGFYSDYEYPSGDTSYPGYDPSASYADPNLQYQPQDQTQQDQIDRLESEVEQLREERARSSAAANSQPATVIVFRDKHTEEVQNYAIVGETLWIFTEARARKIPLSDLDIPATQKANDDRGIDFELPNQN